VTIGPTEQITATVYAPTRKAAHPPTIILGHGAGAGQTSDFMVRFANGLAARGVAAVTFNFAYMEACRRVPDRNDKLEDTYLKVIAAVRSGSAGKDVGQDRLVIGGKSMGGRIASQVAARTPDGIDGIVALGYPLHPPGQPDKLRINHLPSIKRPFLIVQGERDAFGGSEELAATLKRLKVPAELRVINGGDHSLKAPKKFGRSQQEVYDYVLDEIAKWVQSIG
jgi:predicted alpha/beta-hydrolase family hydrolase